MYVPRSTCIHVYVHCRYVCVCGYNVHVQNTVGTVFGFSNLCEVWLAYFQLHVSISTKPVKCLSILTYVVMNIYKRPVKSHVDVHVHVHVHQYV